jgi:two-component system cell cycle sensor histidine kinase/response regulator CckA
VTPRPLRVLFVEDSEDDLALELRELRKGGFDPAWERVDTEAALRDALMRGPWDVVVSDHSMPKFSSDEALRVVRERDPDLPFLLVSGTIGEGPAVDAMRTGAQDYILKGNLQRLAAAIDRELRAARGRRLRRTSEQALRQAEERNRGLIENAVLGIYRAHLDGRFEDANPALLAMLGHGTLEELRARAPQDVYGDAATAERLHFEWFAAGRFRRVECRWRRADRAPITVLLSGRLVSACGGPSMFEVFVEDVTEQKSLEAQFVQAQKLEALAQLTAGVAHDFNNLLTVISGFTHVVMDDMPSDDRHTHYLASVVQASDRSAALVRQILAFSRRQAAEPRALDVNALVAGVENMLRRLLRAGITVETKLAPDLGAVAADPGQIEQVLMNLVVNARDAIPGEGRIRVSTREETLDAPFSRREGVIAPGRWVVLSVSDTGEGMSQETIARIFTPFFTTKAPGKGTGLGLSTVYGIVRSAGGHVLVDSRLGAGTTFTVWLPRVEAPVAAAGGPSAPHADVRGAETVLVAEDEEDVRRLLCAVLAGCGYEVLAARSAGEALEIAQRRAGRIDLLVADLVMPGVDGAALAETLRASRPDLAVLFVSGYASDEPTPPDSVVAASLLRKPFVPRQLAVRAREALDRRAGRSAPADAGEVRL